MIQSDIKNSGAEFFCLKLFLSEFYYMKFLGDLIYPSEAPRIAS